MRRKKEQREAERLYVEESSAKMLALMGRVRDKKLNKRMERAYDVLHGSQTKSNARAKEYEQTVMALLTALEQSIRRDNLDAAAEVVDELIATAEERNYQARIGQ
ncbi:MAG: hypothetical protein LUD78_05280 [Clostridiales bacterium]|nr:hypothetical protein [Clostridiales bacterium]